MILRAYRCFNKRPTRRSTRRMGRDLLFLLFAYSVLSSADSTHENDSIFGATLQDLDLQSILSKLQLSFFNTKAAVQECSPIPRGMFTEQLRKQEEEFLIEHRHDNQGVNRFFGVFIQIRLIFRL